MKFVIDAYAWIEYLEGSTKGSKVKNILIDDNEIYTTSLTIAEVVSRAKRKGGNAVIAYETIITKSKIININSEIANEVGLFHANVRKRIKYFGLADSVVYIVASKLGAKIVTGDPHFKGFKEASLI